MKGYNPTEAVNNGSNSNIIFPSSWKRILTPLRHPMSRYSNRAGCLIVAIGFIILLHAYLSPSFSVSSTSSVSISSNKTATRMTSIEVDRRDFLMVAEHSYLLYILQRKALVPNASVINPWPQRAYRSPTFWDYFLATFSCPYAVDRVGYLGDGGKYICGLELYETPKISQAPGHDNNPNCTVYSFGISKEASFEASLLARTPCFIYAYDASIGSMPKADIPSVHPRLKFHQLFIGAKDNPKGKTLTLKTLMEENGHDWIDILKMDIESKEFEVLDQIINDFDTLPFGQLQVEFHADEGGKRFPFVYKLWERMEVKGLRAFRSEINPYPHVINKRAKNPALMEYSFINIKADRSPFKLYLNPN